MFLNIFLRKKKNSNKRRIKEIQKVSNINNVEGKNLRFLRVPRIRKSAKIFFAQRLTRLKSFATFFPVLPVSQYYSDNSIKYFA